MKTYALYFTTTLLLITAIAIITNTDSRLLALCCLTIVAFMFAVVVNVIRYK